MLKEQVTEDNNSCIKKIFDSLGYESGYDYEKLPTTFDLSEIDENLLSTIPELLKKILTDVDNRETGYMAKIRGKDVELSQIKTGTSDGAHISFDIDDFLGLYKVDGVRKREKLLYDIHTHEVADIGPSPRDLINLFKEVHIFGCHFSIVLTATKIYLLVRTQQTPSMKVMDAVQHVDKMQTDFVTRFAQAVRNEQDFVATEKNKNRLLAQVNTDWVATACRDNSIGLYTVDVLDFQSSQKVKLKKID